MTRAMTAARVMHDTTRRRRLYKSPAGIKKHSPAA